MEFNGYFLYQKGVETEELQNEVKDFYNSLTTERRTFGISLAQILKCKLLIVKKDKGIIVGIAGVLNGNYTFVVVKKEYQSQRIGTVLFGEMIKWAPKSNCDFITGNALASNAKINYLWKKVGGRILYTSSIGGREHNLQFISYNWRGVAWGNFLRLTRILQLPNELVTFLSRKLRTTRLYLTD